MNLRVAIPLLVAVAEGCSWGEPPAFTVTGVGPPSAVSGEATILTVTVAGLTAATIVDFDDPALSEVCDHHRVELHVPGGEAVELEDVVRVSETELRGRVGADAPRYTYFDVTVVDPGGRAASLPAAFQIVKCSAPNMACDDLEPCTYDGDVYDPQLPGSPADQCVGVDYCAGPLHFDDGTACQFACTRGGSVEGSCLAGRCVPLPGRCEPPTPCAAP